MGFEFSGQPRWQYGSVFSCRPSQFLIDGLKKESAGHSTKVRFPVVLSQVQYNEQLSG